MDKKAIYAIIVVVILIVAAVSAYVVISNDDDGGNEPTVMDEAELKVYGNINGDRYLDASDASLIQQLIEDGATAEEYPLADTNMDGTLDSDDVSIINDVVAGKQATVWHYNYHDVDGDSVMDEELVSTTFPITSCIISASSNTSLMCFVLGIIDEVKGAAYSATSMDAALYGNNFMDTSKVEKIGTSAMKIAFEDGKVGSSDIIATEHVTALITDWNRSYITNQSDFENASIDVIRTAGASTDPEVITHSLMLMGLLFDKVDRADAYLNLNLQILDYVEGAVSGADAANIVVCSSTGGISGPNSDYTTIAELAGGKYALDDKVDFAGSTSIKIEEHPEIYTYDIDYILHLRTSVNYSQDPVKIAENYAEYTEAFADWQYADTNQYMISGSIPATLRVAYTTTVLHSDLVDIDKINDYHQQLVDQFYNGLEFDISEMTFVVGPDTF